MTAVVSAKSPPDLAARQRAGRGGRTPTIDIERPAHVLFEAQAARRPDAIALQTKADSITYDQLNCRANRMARRIEASGGAPGDRVALLVDQNADAIAAMLGSLKAGRIYVPVDPSYPRPRIEHILRDAQASLVIAQDCHAEVARAAAVPGTSASVVDVRDILAESAAGDDSNLDRPLRADSVAYILYTSGSTGQPKGVIQTHRNLLNFVRSYATGLGIADDDRLTLFYSFSFSASLMDSYGGLLTGATVLPHFLKAEGIAGLADWIDRQRITVYHSVPTVFRHLLESLAGDRKLSTVRVLDLGGEPVYARDVELFKRHFLPGSVMVNHLAFTESSVSAQYFIDHTTEIRSPHAPAGLAAANVEILLLDEKDQPVPPGETGQMVVRSEHLSPGYWNQPELTAASFSADAGTTGARCYRSGDLGRINPDGLLEHLGRKDFRIKIRGLTIEVAEIESALVKTGAVRDARVLAREYAPGDQRLVAYIIPVASAPPAEQLRVALKQSLPEYMLPAAFVPLSAFPLSPNGKLDSRAILALPLPDAPSAAPTAASSQPSDLTPVQSHLVDIWKRVLGVKAVGLDDNFFDLGGHSLLAMKMLAQVEVELGRRIVVNLMAQRPTVRGLAEAITRHEGDHRSSILVPLQPQGSRTPLVCITPDHLLHFAKLVIGLGPDQPVYGLQSPYPDGFRVPDVTVEQMARIYFDELTRALPSGPIHLLGFCGGGVMAFELAQRLRTAGRTIGMLALIDTPRHYTGLRQHKVGKPRYYARRLVFHGNVARQLPLCMGAAYLTHRSQSAMGKFMQPMGADYVEPIGLTAAQNAILAANRNAFARYQPTPYPGRIDIFLAGDSFSIYRDDPRLAWRELAGGGARVHWVPGGHQSMLGDVGMTILLHHLRLAMSRQSW